MFSSIHTNAVLASLLLPLLTFAQTPVQGQRVLGVVTEKQGSGAKIRTDAGEVFSLVFSGETKYQKIPPGETTLKNAQTITFADLADGDRVLARGVGTNAKTVVAQSVVVMSKTDLADKGQKERQDWQKRGITGSVTAVDAAKKEIVIKLPSLTEQKSVTVLLKENAPLRRYTQDSVRFSDAKPAEVSDIRTGDQLRARGEKSEDGLRFTAEEVVTGTFQTLAGTVVSVNAEANEIQMKDIDSGKLLTVRLTADSTMKRMPSMPAGPGGPGPGGAARPGGGMMGRMPDIGQMMERLPRTTLAEVKAGETLIVASAKGATADRMTAITVLAGADRLIAMRRAMSMQAGAASQARGAGAQSGSWNLGDMSAMPTP